MGTRGGRLWELLAALAGLIMMISLLLPWYFMNGQTYSGSGAFGWTDKLIVINGILVIILPYITQRRPTPGREQAYVAVVTALSLLTLVVIAIRLGNPPELAKIARPVSLRGGAFVGLVSAICLVLSLLASMGTRISRRGAQARA